MSSAQLGRVVSTQKVSDTQGGFDALLDDEDQFGRSIVNLGDLDGDGVTDLMVGAHTDDDGGLDKGAVYVLFMYPNGYVKSWSKISDLSGNFSGRLSVGDQFGRAAACIGDLDLDGVVDVVVSSNYDDDGGANKGAVYVLFLNQDGTVKSSQKISSLEGGLPATLDTHDEFGRSISSLDDLDGDGVTDIVVGTPEDDDGGTNTGALHVLFLNRDGTVKGYHRISRSTEDLRLQPGDWFGHCTANLGDFDSDGVTDLLVGSLLADDGGFNQGSVWILLLRSDGSLKASYEINELVGGFDADLDEVDQFGTSVANLGDLDGDGITDIAVGAVKDDDGSVTGNPDSDVGAVYILFLNADVTVKHWVKLSDTEGDFPNQLDQYDWFGSALAPVGGLPGDGLFNLAIGCRNDDDGNPNRGAIYMVQLNDGTAPVADFTASRTVGVAPMTVDFFDTTSGEVSAWVWNFSEGNLSSLQNPSRTFALPGTYTIQLAARGPKGKDIETKTGYITVVPGPLADFTADPSEGIAPLTVQFTDLTDGEVSAWGWDFGDGETSDQASPAHTYEPGTYTVTLAVSGPQGTDTKAYVDLIVARDLVPRAEFSSSSNLGLAPHEILFSDGSGGEVTAWAWSFGDGGTSNESDPLHTYTVPGLYEVSLTASGPYGVDVETKSAWIVIQDPVPVAEFSTASSSGFAPFGVRFGDLSTGDITSYSWDFGDGLSSPEASPFHVFEEPGLFTVSLTVDGPSGSDTETKVEWILVNEAPPQADFQATSTAGYAPFAAQFTDQSSGTITSASWNLGDGTILSDPSVEYTYSTPGVYAVSLTVQGPFGSDTTVKNNLISVLDPTPAAGLEAFPASGVAPLSVRFTSASSGDITTWAWDFGDGVLSSERDPRHDYLLAGTYDVTLSVQGPAGSDQVVEVGRIVVTEPPARAAFEALPTVGYPPLSVQFADLSQGTITTHSWSFGDGEESGEPSPSHVYTTPGSYDVRLTVAGPTAGDFDERLAFVTVLDPAPTADFSASSNVGPGPLEVQFADLSGGLITAWAWDFGDGASSSEASPLHAFAAPGSYTVSLVVTGPAGQDAEVKAGLITVEWPAPEPDFTAGPLTGFAPLPVAFTDFTSGEVTSWIWRFGDGSSSRQRYPIKVYNSPGSYTVSLTVTGPGGTRTVTHGGIEVDSEPIFPDGGFEGQTGGSTPALPWVLAAGTNAVVHAVSNPDSGFAAAGSLWCEITADGSSEAFPPTQPGGEGEMPVGAAAMEQTVSYTPLAPHLLFDVAFLLGGEEDSDSHNDFMSVDLSDGETTWNVFYADSFSDFVGLSSKHLLPITGAQRVQVDLRTLFPQMAQGAPLLLRVSLGNAADEPSLSRGYVDSFHFVPAATATFRNGTGRNAVRYVSSPPVLGGDWTVQVDTTGHAGATMIQLVGTMRPASGLMRTAGEALIAGRKQIARSWLAQPGLNVQVISLPVDLSLLGVFMATQASITGGGAELCNAYDVVLGF